MGLCGSEWVWVVAVSSGQLGQPGWPGEQLGRSPARGGVVPLLLLFVLSLLFLIFFFFICSFFYFFSFTKIITNA